MNKLRVCKLLSAIMVLAITGSLLPPCALDTGLAAAPAHQETTAPHAGMPSGGVSPPTVLRDRDPDWPEVRRAALSSPAPDVASAQALGWPRIDVTPPAPLQDDIKAFPDERPPAADDVRVFGDAATRPPQATAMAQEPVSPTLAISPEYLIFFATQGTNPAAQPLHVRNRGQGTLTYTLEEDLPWLALSATSGSVSDGEDVVTLSVDTAGLSVAGSPFVGSIAVHNVDDPADIEWVWVRLSLSTLGGYSSLYSYDGNGNLQRRVDGNGAIIDYEYDALNRLTRIRYPDGTSVAYEYDANGNRQAMTDSWGTTQYVYDAYNRLTAVYYPGLNPVQYVYDKAGKLTEITYPDQRVMSYGYDQDGRMVSAADGTVTTTYGYAPAEGIGVDVNLNLIG